MLATRYVTLDELEAWYRREEFLLTHRTPIGPVTRSRREEDIVRGLGFYRRALIERGITTSRDPEGDINAYIASTLEADPPWEMFVYILPYENDERVIVGQAGVQAFSSLTENMSWHRTLWKTPSLQLLFQMVGEAFWQDVEAFIFRDHVFYLGVSAELGRLYIRPYRNYGSEVVQKFVQTLLLGLQDVVAHVERLIRRESAPLPLALTMISATTMRRKGERLAVRNPSFGWQFRIKNGVAQRYPGRVAYHTIGLLSPHLLPLFHLPPDLEFEPHRLTPLPPPYSRPAERVYAYVLLVEEDYVEMPPPYTGVAAQWKRYFRALGRTLDSEEAKLDPVAQAPWNVSIMVGVPR